MRDYISSSQPGAVLTVVAAAVVIASLASAQRGAAQDHRTGDGSSAAVMADDGQDNFLILNDDEVKANPQLLAFLEQANKEEVESLVEQNPKFQDVILKRIRSAVEARQQNRQAGQPQKTGAMSNSQQFEQRPYQPQVPQVQQQQQMVVEESSKLQDSQQLFGMPAEANEDDDDEDNDDDDRATINKLKVAKFQADVKKNALKIYKIGTGLKGKVSAFLKKSKLKKKAKKKAAWPKITYKVATT